MNQRKAEAVLRAVETKYAEWLALDNSKGTEYGPQLVRGYYRRDDWCIVWEKGSPDEWAIKWGWNGNEDPAGTFCEPVYSFVLGIYDA